MERSIRREEADVRSKEDLSQAKVDLVLDDFRGRTVSDPGRGHLLRLLFAVLLTIVYCRDRKRFR